MLLRLVEKYFAYVYSRTLAVLYIMVSCMLFLWVCRFHPGYLVDETFHVEMGKMYCNGFFWEWNNKITTLPGLYIISTPILKLLGLILQTDTCNVFYLRSVNYLTGILNGILFGLLIFDSSELLPPYSLTLQSKYLILTLNQLLFPLLYFFTFFYYTEPMSVFAVFLMYYLYLRGSHKSAACAGIVAILIRQTNVVWVGFIIILQFTTELMNDMRKIPIYQRIIDDGETGPIIMVMARHAVDMFLTWNDLVVKYIINSVYFRICVAFLSFVVVNKGIVVGDRGAHSIVIHVPQLLYFTLFYLYFCPTSIILFLPKFLKTVMSSKLQAGFIAISLAIIIYSNTLVHPYLLADNRHYAFYVWKRLYESNITFRYLLIPVYMLGGFSILERLKQIGIPFMLAYIVATFFVLIPQMLFEFRYFMLPFLFLSINSGRRQVWEIVVESVYFIAINALTFYIFYSRKIVWSDDQTIHRFLW